MIFTKELIGSNITCYINGNFIDDAEIHFEYGDFFILQNKCNGHRAQDTKHYYFSWVISNPTKPYENGVTSIEIIKSPKLMTHNLIKYIIQCQK